MAPFSMFVGQPKIASKSRKRTTLLILKRSKKKSFGLPLPLVACWSKLFKHLSSVLLHNAQYNTVKVIIIHNIQTFLLMAHHKSLNLKEVCVYTSKQATSSMEHTETWIKNTSIADFISLFFRIWGLRTDKDFIRLALTVFKCHSSLKI